ncbi:MAG: helix-turn-helix domain-containing protein, partial [Planctomycetota bacterium]
MVYTTAQAAKQIGVCKNTLLRWVYEGLIPDVGQDWRGWRSWS